MRITSLNCTTIFKAIKLTGRFLNKHGEYFRTVNPKTLIIINHCVNKGYDDEIMGSENF